MDRVRKILPPKGDPVYNMKRLLEVVGPVATVPEPDKYYVFVYKAKTPRIQYDQFPFVVVTAVYQWGFTGYNFHWEESRAYTWSELKTPLYEINEDELTTVSNYPIKSIKST